MDYDELERSLQKAFDDAIVHIEPTEKSVLSGFVGTWNATEGPNPVPVQVCESNPKWWEDWMYEDE